MKICITEEGCSRVLTVGLQRNGAVMSATTPGITRLGYF